MFLPTLDLTADDLEALHAGTLTLQTGQWVKYGHMTTKSRFVGRTPGGSVWAVHEGSYEDFQGVVANYKRVMARASRSV